jgi:hypothetical protein
MKKILFSLILFFCINNNSHIAIIPYPYTNREYPLLEQKLTNQKFFSLVAVPFYRSASEGFQENRSIKNVSNIFHGNDYFEISDLSPEQKVLFLESHKNPLYKDELSSFEYIRYEGRVQPQYKINDLGIVLGADFLTTKNDFSYKIQLRLPLIKKEVLHEKGWAAIEYNDVIDDERLNLEDFNKHFFVRGDYLSERGILPPIKRNNNRNEGIIFTEKIPEDYFLLKEKIEETESQITIRQHQSKEKEFEEVDEKEIFAMTKFTENAEPTTDSINFFTTLEESIKIDRNNILKKTTKGNFLGKNIEWGTINNTGFGPLDMQLGIDYRCFENQGIISGLISFVLPMQKKEKVPHYISYSFFEDHYALRFGSQGSYIINPYYKIVCYGSWQRNFPKTEMIPAVFENQTAFGLNPLYLKGKTSWNEWFFAADLVITYNKKYGGYLGYEFFKKTKDKIVPQLNEFQTVSGETYPLNYSTWEKFTDSYANILVCSAYAHFKKTELSIEYKTVITGKNIMNMQEINFKLGCKF